MKNPLKTRPHNEIVNKVSIGVTSEPPKVSVKQIDYFEEYPVESSETGFYESDYCQSSPPGNYYKNITGASHNETVILNSPPTTNPKDLIGTKKPSMSLVPPIAILELANAFKDGAAKYNRFNWRSTQVRQTVYIDAALRHLLAMTDGEDYTRDSHVRHEAAIMACMAIIVDARAQGTLIDDRPVAGKFSDLLEEYTVNDKP